MPVPAVAGHTPGHNGIPTSSPLEKGPTMPTRAATSRTRRHAMACVAILVTLGFALGCSEFVPIGIQPQLADAFGVSIARTGELISLYSVAYAIATPVLAIVTGRFRRYTLLAVYSAVFCAANLLMVTAPNFAVLLVSRVLLGMVSGALLAIGITYLPELMGVRRTSLGVSLVYAAFSVAMVVATSLGKLAAEAFTWHVAMVGAAVFAVAVCALALAMLPRDGATDGPATFRDQAALLAEPQVLTGIMVFLFGVGSVYVFYGYVTPYLQEVLGLGAVAASGILMAYGCLTFFSNLLSGILDRQFGIKATVAVFLLQAALLAGLFLAGGAGHGVAFVLALGLTMYLCCVPCVSLYMRSARLRHPKALTLASSLEPMAYNLGIASGTAVGGAVVAGPGLRFVGLAGAALALVVCGVAALTARLAHRRRE